MRPRVYCNLCEGWLAVYLMVSKPRGIASECKGQISIEQPPGILGAELQHEKACELVGGILLAAPNRYLENIENGV